MLGHTAPERWAGTGQGEPHRVGEQDAGRGRGGDQTHRGVVNAAPELGRMPEGGSDDDDADADHRGDGHDHQDLGADEELEGDQQPEHHPDPYRTTTPSDQQLVQAGHDQRRDEGHPEHQVGVGETDQDEGREPVEQASEERCRRPGHPAL